MRIPSWCHKSVVIALSMGLFSSSLQAGWFANKRLYYASKSDDSDAAEKVQKLLLEGANSNYQDRHGHTPLMRACEQQNEAMVAALLSKDADPFLHDKDDRTALSFASQFRRGSGSKIMRLLIQAALSNKYFSEESLKRKVRDGLINRQDKYGNTPLHYALISGNKELAKDLIEAKANVVVQNKKYMSPLQLAIKNNDAETVGMCLAVAGDLNSFDFRHLPKKKSKKDKPTPIPTTLLMESARYQGSGQITEKILRKGVTVDLPDNLGNTALHYAAQTGQKSKIYYLLNAGADRTIKNDAHQTPLKLARNHADALSALMGWYPKGQSRSKDKASELLSAILELTK